MNRRDFLKRLGLFPFLPILSSQPAPNIILILADDLGASSLGAYGGTMIQTPHIDNLAANGLRFTQAYSGAPVCSPSRRTLLTGRHTGRHKNASWTDLEPGDVTIIQRLKARGYRTGLFGKWGLSDTSGLPPELFGVDHFFGVPHTHQASGAYPQTVYRNGAEVNTGGKYAPDLYLAEMLDFITTAQKPFFACYSSNIPHIENVSRTYQLPPGGGLYTTTGWAQIESDYATVISYLDQQIGQIVAAAPPDTIIIFTSDNGIYWERAPFFGTGGLRGAKAEVYEGGIRIPLIISWPGRVIPGVSSAPVWLVDLPVTLADIAGVTFPAGDGVSLLPHFLGDAGPGRDHFYWGYYREDAGELREAVRVDDFKLVRVIGESERLEIFDLVADPGETVNLATAYPDLVWQMGLIMDRYCPNPKTCKLSLPIIERQFNGF